MKPEHTVRNQIEQLAYDLEQEERQLAQRRRQMRAEQSLANGQTTATSMYEYHRRQVERLKEELHQLRMK